jgi:hypothetical protein
MNMIAPMALLSPRRNLTADERRALSILAGSPDGCSKSLMMAHGLPVGVLDDIARSGLAIESREVEHVARRPILVAKLRITAAGREAMTGKT